MINITYLTNETPQDRARNQLLIRKYGLSYHQYNKLLAHQGGVCAICRRPPKTMRLAVDHDHKTGQVRGLLCFFCNKKVIGRHRQEHAWKFERAALYLKSPIDWRTYDHSASHPVHE